MSGPFCGTGTLARTALLFASIGLAAAAPALAVNGTVLDSDGDPIPGANVCYVKHNVDLLCSLSDEQGYFELIDSTVDTLRAQADGYNPVTFSAATHEGSVVLELAPVLLVRLLDRASGEGIKKGEVVVVLSTGKQKGPFPTNPAGVRIRRGLSPGEVRLIGKAEGYEDSDPRSVTLVGGRKVEVELELDAVPMNDTGD